MYEFFKCWAQIAPGFIFLVAMLAVLVAWRQLALNRVNQRETTAKAIFRDYLRLAFEYPEFASGEIPPGKQSQYEWFVGYFLWAAEEILDYAKNDSTWRVNLELNAKKHRNYFKNNEEFREVEIKGYKQNVRALIERVIQQP